MPRVIASPAYRAQIIDGKRYWNEWDQHCKNRGHFRGNGRVAAKAVNVDFSRYTPDNYLLTWITAVAGVEVESDGHTIVSPHNQFINDNGNSWRNEVLLESYHSFILAENFTEHVSIPEFSKGKVLDAVSWVVEKQFNGYREPIPTVFIDVLLATSKKKHPLLVKKIVSGVLANISMGCDILWSQCSRCGEEIEEGYDEPCDHIKNQLGKYYIDKGGIKRRVSELCGLPGVKDSCQFKEVSWVSRPAFLWARLHGFLEYGDVSTGRPLKAIVPISRHKESNREV
jgi:hypothetical protein